MPGTPLIAFSIGAATVCSMTSRRGARIDGLHGDDRRRDLRILRDRQRAHRGQAGEHEEHRDHRREDRAVDEEAREHGESPRSVDLFGGADCRRCRAALVGGSAPSRRRRPLARRRGPARPSPGAAAAGAPARRARRCAPPSLIGPPGISLAMPSTITWSPGLQPRLDDPQVAAVGVDPVAERRRAAASRRPCRPCPCRRRRRTCPAGRPARRPAARRSRSCARRRAARTRTNWPGFSAPSALAISARISYVPVVGLMRVSEKLMRPLRGSVVPSDSLTVTSYALSFGSIELVRGDGAVEPQLLVLGDVEADPDRIDLRDRRQQRVVGGDEAAFRLLRAARQARDRRDDRV